MTVDRTPEFSTEDIFALERVYPDTADLFQAHAANPTSNIEMLVALDTNALVLPYTFKAGNLKALQDVYKKLSLQKRLFLPDRVVREFTRLRDSKLSEIIQALQDRKSQGVAAEMPPLLDTASSFSEVVVARDKLTDARTAYVSAIDKLIEEIKGWRGNDPIVRIYSEIFSKETISVLSYDKTTRDEFIADWNWRLKNKVPPGYKDQSKDDDGIGDYLVWRSLLALGEAHKKDMAFVTGEQKADWFVRSGKSGVFPRPELVAEYRSRSGGKTLRLLTLYQLLEEMDAPAVVVASVKEAEDTANTVISVEAGSVTGAAKKLGFLGKKSFDYSTNDGKIEIAGGGTSFTLRFSKGSDQSIYLYTDGTNLSRIGRVKTAKFGDRIKAENYDTSSRVYSIQKGEYFLAVNNDGRMLVGKILSISDDTRGAPSDEVVFVFSINHRNEDSTVIL